MDSVTQFAYLYTFITNDNVPAYLGGIFLPRLDFWESQSKLRITTGLGSNQQQAISSQSSGEYIIVIEQLSKTIKSGSHAAGSSRCALIISTTRV